jgi:hypothetical protein
LAIPIDGRRALFAEFRFVACALAILPLGVVYGVSYFTFHDHAASFLLGLAAFAFSFQIGFAQLRIRNDFRVKSDKEREHESLERYKDALLIRATFADVENHDVETAALLLEEAKASFDRVYDETSKIESKAAALLTLVAGASSAIGVFGLTRDGHPVTASLSVRFAAGFAVAALFFVIAVHRSKDYDVLAVDEFLDGEFLAADFRAAISLMFARSYVDFREKLSRACRWDSTCLYLAMFSLVGAVGFVMLGVFQSPDQAAARGHQRPTANIAPVRGHHWELLWLRR